MRKFLFCGCAIIALQYGNAQALTEPERMKSGEFGDDRIRVVYWQAGSVIKAVAARGQSLMIEMPRGYELGAVMLSDQDVMVDAQEEETGANRPAGPQGQAPRDDGCTTTKNLQVCVQRKRFMFIKPITILTNQPIPMIMLEEQKNKKLEPIEHPMVFELSTLTEIERDKSPYYQIKVIVGNKPDTQPDAVPEVVAKQARHRARIGSVARAWSQTQPQPQPQQNSTIVNDPAKNSRYIIQGDRTLLGR